MSKNFRHQPFVAVLGNLGPNVVDNVVLSHEQGMHSTTSLDENCRGSVFHRHEKFYVDSRLPFVPLKLKLTKSRGHYSYIPEEVRREQEAEPKEAVEDAADEEMENFFDIHVSNFFRSFSSIVEVDINNPQLCTSDGLYANKSWIFSNLKLSLDT